MINSHQDLKPSERFSDRVDNYVKYRPRYPDSVIDFFKTKFGLKTNHVIVDIGSGTGISSEIFLKNGNIVYGVEPNENMRKCAEQELRCYSSNFISINGTSEQTNLPDGLADFIIAAQAFHWFQPSETKREFHRILKPGGRIALLWNDRKTDSSSFSRAYENIIQKYNLDYEKVNHKNINKEKIKEFLGTFEFYEFDNFQELDFSGLLGRLTSSSYMPNIDHPSYNEMRDALKIVFDNFQQNGMVCLEYKTQLFSNKFPN